MAMFMAAEKFLAKYLDGRYQEGGTPEVVARLKEITVDPKTVMLAKKVDAAAVGVPKTGRGPEARHVQVQGEDRRRAARRSRSVSPPPSRKKAAPGPPPTDADTQWVR